MIDAHATEQAGLPHKLTPGQAEPVMALPDKLTPGLRGRDIPPPPSAGGQEIRITIQGEGGPQITITLRAPDHGEMANIAPHAAVSAPAVESHPIALQPITHSIAHSHVAGVSVKAPDTQAEAVPSTTLVLNHLFQSKGEQIDIAERRFGIHEQLDKAMQEAFAPMMQSIDPAIFQQATRIVHQVMAELLSGNTILAVPADEIMQIRDAMVDTALMEVKNTKGKSQQFNPNALRQSLGNHPLVLDFKQMHRPSHGHYTNMKYHPRTGVESNTKFGANVAHHGKVDEIQRGQMADAAIDY
jgi:hypothetical protein